MKRAFTTSVAALVLAGAQLCMAGEAGPGEALSRTVSYGDLNLASPAGIEVLHRRLSQAAEQVCAPLDGRQLRARLEYRECVSKALNDSVTRMDRPLLTEYHLHRHQGAVPRVAAR